MACFRYTFTVRFADVDNAGFVYYPTFYHYFHVAFEEFFEDRLGPGAYRELLDVRHIGFPAVHSECDYHSPLRFADRVETELSLARLGSKSVSLLYQVSCVDGQRKTLCARGKVTCAVTDLKSFRAIEIPKDLQALFVELSEPVRW